MRALFTFLISLLFISSLAAKTPPNFIIFLVDDMGWADVSYNGSTFYNTPNIDQMATEGIIFSNAYANAPNCAPTRASLLTGKYTPRHGIYTVGSSQRGQSNKRILIPTPNNTTLDTKHTTIAEALKKIGYKTFHVGKWHLGGDEQTLPTGQGFDKNIGGNHHGHPKSYFSPYRNPNLSNGDDGEYLTDRLTSETLQIIEQHKNSPFFIYLSHYAVHTPIQSKQHLTKKYQSKRPYHKQDNAKYAAMIESTDQSLGAILNKLKQLKIDSNTYVIFFSDNGGHGKVTDQYPLRGSKGTLYEGGIREPMIIWSPNNIKKGSHNNTPVIGCDIFPTILDLAHSEYKEYHLDGQSLKPLLKQNGKWQKRAIFWHFPAYLQSYKGIKHPNDLTRGFRAVPSGAVRLGNWKLIQNFEDGSTKLFNLKKDISEQCNLAKQHPQKTKQLLHILQQWQTNVHAPIPDQKNPKYIPNSQ